MNVCMIALLLVSSTLFLTSTYGEIKRYANTALNIKHVKRADFMVDLWSKLNTPLNNKPFLYEFDTRCEGIEKGIRNHIGICRDNGLLKQSHFIYTPQGFQIESPSNKPIEKSEIIVNSDEIMNISKTWVKRMIAGFGICPFTIDEQKAGIPRGGIHYAISHAKNYEEAFCDFWKQTSHFLSTDNSEISTVLLIYSQPHLFADFAEFTKFSECLDNSLENHSLDFEEQIQMVYFHPEYEFVDKDGQVYFIFDAQGEVIGLSSDFVEPVSCARRSPWPIINILRTPQVKAVQKGVPEGKVFAQNKEMLGKVGSDTLQNMLESRDWSDLPINAPYLKTVIQSQYTNQQEALKKVGNSNINSNNSKQTVVSLTEGIDGETLEGNANETFTQLPVETVVAELEAKKETGNVDASDYLNFADEIEKWLAAENNK